MEIVNFKREHLDQIDEHVYREAIIPQLTPAILDRLEERPHSYSVFHKDKPVCCGGLTQYWPGREEAWSILDKNIKSDFVKLHNVVRKFLDDTKVRRIEAVVDADFKEGLRWVTALGFEIEAHNMVGYGRYGEDSILLSRIREWN